MNPQLQRWRDRLSHALTVFFSSRNTSVLSAEQRTQLEFATSMLAAVVAFWLWALSTTHLRGGHDWQWPVAVVCGLFTAFFGGRAARLRALERRFALRTQALVALGARRAERAATVHAKHATVYSKALGVLVIARLLAELGWALERPTSGAFTIVLSLGIGGATLAASLLWLVWSTMDLAMSLGAFDYECAMLSRSEADGGVKLVLFGREIVNPDVVVVTLLGPNGERHLCQHTLKQLAVRQTNEAEYELDVRVLDPRSVSWTTVGYAPASLELMVAPGFTMTLALGIGIDALRPKRPRY